MEQNRNRFSSIPDDVIFEWIAPRLPAEAVGRFRSTSISWRNELSSQRFVQLHLEHHYDNDKIMFRRGDSLYALTPTLALGVDDHNAADAKLKTLEGFRLLDRELMQYAEVPMLVEKVIGSCNGLVLVNRVWKSFFSNSVLSLLNPTTRQGFNIPRFDYSKLPRYSCQCFGFGFDKPSNDYKIVSLQYMGKYFEELAVLVYSVISDSWERHEDLIPGSTYCLLNDSGIHLNGCIHWLAEEFNKGYAYTILTFDLSDNTIKLLPTPEFETMVSRKLEVIRGCITLTTKPVDNQSTDIWVMEDYGIKESWTRFFIDGVAYVNLMQPLVYMVDDDSCILGKDECVLILGNIVNHSWRIMRIPGNPIRRRANQQEFDRGFSRTLLWPEWIDLVSFSGTLVWPV